MAISKNSPTLKGKQNWSVVDNAILTEFLPYFSVHSTQCTLTYSFAILFLYLHGLEEGLSPGAEQLS